MNKNSLSAYINTISLVVLSVFLFIFPTYFLLPTVATEAFILPRQILTVLVVSTLLVLWGIRSIIEKKIVLKTTPFNIPIIVFGVIIFLSSLLSRNMYDSLASVIPVLAVLFLFGAITQIVDTKRAFNIALSSFALGGVVSALITILSYLKIYVLPFTAVQSQYFNTFGSPVQQIAYLTPIFAIALFMLFSRHAYKKITSDYSAMISAAVAVITLAGVVFLVYQIMVTPQKPQILPVSFGFQIATAAVSQDASRLLVSLPFGSGYGTFLTDFTRFKLPNINANPAIWNLTFSYSSTFVLELLTTTGILGMLAYLYLLVRVLRTREHALSPLFISLLVIFGMSFLIPFSFPLVFMLFVLLGFYASSLFISGDRRVYDIVLSLVAFRRGLLSFEEEGHRKKTEGLILPVVFFVIVAIVFGSASYLAVTLALADSKIAQSFAQNQQTDGQKIYNLQREAIAIFPYRSDYYRIFSQLNLGLASSVSNNIPKGQKVTPETQQLVTQLLQQAIANGRGAITLAPITSVNWENLAQIYRNLINVGQNADQFAIASMQQSIALDPYNPLLRIELGGIYYQIGQYDRAQDQFQAAISLKPDLANAYYNLGHTYEAKGDLANALSAYQLTMSYITVQSDKDALAKEIDVLKDKIATGATGQSQTPEANSTTNQPPLEISTPSNPLPTQSQQVKISPPPTGVEKAPTPTP